MVADQVLVSGLPLWATDDRDSELTESAIGEFIFHEGPGLKVDARCECNKLVHVMSVVRILNLSEAVEHLSGSHRIADVVHLWPARDLNDLIHEGGDVVLAHFTPAEVPSLEGLLLVIREVWVIVAVLRASAVAHPQVIASIDQLQMHWLSILRVVKPALSIAVASRNRKDRHFVRRCLDLFVLWGHVEDCE